MKNPTPGKNPFELQSYVDKMPPLVREIYFDMTRDFYNFKGKATRAQFWRFMIFALCYVAALLYIADVTTETILIFLGLLFCGWLYIAVPSLSISFRRLHDAHQSVLWAFIPQVTLFYGISEFAIGIPPNLIIWAILSFFTLCAFIFMSLPSYPSDVSRISAKDEK